MKNTSLNITVDIDQYAEGYAQRKGITKARALRELIELGMKVDRHLDDLGIDDILGGKASIPYHEKAMLLAIFEVMYLLRSQSKQLPDGADLLIEANQKATRELQKIMG